MPFVKLDIDKEIEKRMNNEEFKKGYLQVIGEYELIMELVERREKMGLSQKEVADKCGLTQQMVSRIETLGNSPTLRNFIKYVDALGLQIKLVEKNESEQFFRTESRAVI